MLSMHGRVVGVLVSAGILFVSNDFHSSWRNMLSGVGAAMLGYAVALVITWLKL